MDGWMVVERDMGSDMLVSKLVVMCGVSASRDGILCTSYITVAP